MNWTRRRLEGFVRNEDRRFRSRVMELFWLQLGTSYSFLGRRPKELGLSDRTWLANLLNDGALLGREDSVTGQLQTTYMKSRSSSVVRQYLWPPRGFLAAPIPDSFVVYLAGRPRLRKRFVSRALIFPTGRALRSAT